ncbi:hypothetical protein ACF06X_06985 [Streptomyces sp. NPDC015346]|uniref:hypothetical protein n=1 Tax=Streptomyces sp. NPDC015346 TaxID=3364954 RepID=UPI0036F80A99
MLTGIVGALLMSAALCFSPVGDSAHRGLDTAVTAPVTATVAAPGGGHTQDRAPHHHGHGHGAGCTFPGLSPQASVTAQHSEAGAAPLAPPARSDVTTPDPTTSRTVAPEAAIARSGRSTQISVCRWRV